MRTLCRLQILPEAVPLPYFFSENELKEIQIEGEERQARGQRQRYTTAFDGLRELLVELVSDLPVSAEEVTLVCCIVPLLHSFLLCSVFPALQDKFLWAASLVSSRALTIRGKKYLVPFADMFNYSPSEVRGTAMPHCLLMLTNFL